MVKRRTAVSRSSRSTAGRKRPRAEAVTSPPQEPVITAPPVPKKKVVPVDGPNIGHNDVRRALNIGQYNYGAFCSILTEEVGEGEMAGPPVWTVRPTFPEYVVKSMEVGGFRVEPVDTTFEADDRFLILKIRGLDPEVVGTLVLVTCDGSFAGAAREAKSRGIKVHWVLAPEVTTQKGYAFVGRETIQLVETEFTLVDIRKFTDRIKSREWEHREPRAQQHQVEKQVKISFEAVVSSRDHTLFMTMVQPALDRFNIKIVSNS